MNLDFKLKTRLYLKIITVQFLLEAQEKSIFILMINAVVVEWKLKRSLPLKRSSVLCVLANNHVKFKLTRKGLKIPGYHVPGTGTHLRVPSIKGTRCRYVSCSTDG